MNILTLLLSVLVASQALSQTLNIGALSPYEQNLHRVGWCREAWLDEGENSQPNLDTHQISDVITLLESNGFMDADEGLVHYKAGQDLKAQLIIGSKILSQVDLDACFEDLKNILTENYVPNFEYMEK